MRQNTRRFCSTYLFNLREMPRCSAELRHSSKWLIRHLQVIQAVTTFYCLGITSGADARAETNELCKSKENVRNRLLTCSLFHPPSYTKTPLKRSHCVDNEKNVTAQLTSKDCVKFITILLGMLILMTCAAAKEHLLEKNKNYKRFTELSYIHIQLCAIPCA